MASAANPTRDDFAALLDESLGGRDFMEGQVVHGKVVAIEKDFAIVDVLPFVGDTATLSSSARLSEWRAVRKQAELDKAKWLRVKEELDEEEK